MLKYSICLALLLSACGGGTGSPAPTTPTDPTPDPGTGGITFSFERPDIAVLEGESTQVVVKAKSSKVIADPLNVLVQSTSAFAQDAMAQIGGTSEFQLNLETSRGLSVGKHGGVLKISLCKDDPRSCKSPYPGSPWTLAYQIEVVSSASNLKPLADLQGAVAWSSLRANAQRTAYVATSSMMDPAKFSLRWRQQGQYQEPLIAARGRLYSKLRVLDENDGALLWQGPTAADTPVISQGKVFAHVQDGNGGSTLSAFDAENGALLARLGEPGARPLSDQLLNDEAFIYQGSRRKFAMATGVQQWVAPAVASVEFFTPSMAAGRIHVLDGENLHIVSAVDGSKLASLATQEGKGASRPFASVADGVERVLASHFNYAGSSLSSFSVTQGKRLWSVLSGFRSSPALADATIYVVNAPRNDYGGAVLEARSSATGELLWSTPLPDAPFFPTAEPVYEVIAVGDWVFVSSNRQNGAATYAISRTNHAINWRFPVNGNLMVSDKGILYIGRPADGSLFAINLR
ncbi:MAG: PQQ-binding-like beta-propeller repeat protein [Pseudomonadales bacterium]